VSGNTFRAFQKLPVRPSETFRTWANGYLQATFAALSTISAPDSYAQYVDDATNDLCEGWRRLTGSEMGYGRGAKLFNLVLKKLACLSCLPAERRTALIRLQHVPLDSYTILGLRSMAPELSIPKSATMKFISDRDQYNRFQSVILEVAQQAGVPPIYYDLLAWDMSHLMAPSRSAHLRPPRLEPEP
jgi:hypothetical protein